MFVTWHLAGSLPHGLYPPPGKRDDAKAFVWMDRYLDTARRGPAFLRQERIATLVVESLHKGVELGHYELGAWVIMPNHVHVLIQPRIPPSRALQSLKGFTARQANRMLGRTGQTLWQAESYDHWVRDEPELERITRYILENPVRVGLAACASEYEWSSVGGAANAGVETSLDAAGTSACATNTSACDTDRSESDTDRSGRNPS